MTDAQAIQAILEAWEDGWDPLHFPDDTTHPLCVPYTYEDEAFETSDLGPIGAWVRVTVQGSTRDQRTSGAEGNRKFETSGRVFVTIFTPPGLGKLENVKLGDDVRAVLEGKRFGELVFYESARRGENWFSTGPTRENGTWLQSTIVTDFHYDQTR